jgi:hypothetical protein
VATNDQAQTSSNQSVSSTESQLSDKQTDTVQYFIPIKIFAFSDSTTWPLFGVFVWPLPFLAIKRFLLKGKWKRKIGNIVELLLSGYSAFAIYSLMFALWLTPIFWSYVATLTITLYLIVHLMEMFAQSGNQSF